MYFNIALTGATGWFGQSFIKKYIEKYGLKYAKVYLHLFSSDGREFSVPGIDYTFQTFILEELDSYRNVDVLVHSAFLTKDKSESLGLAKFEEINRRITDKVINYARRNNTLKVFSISSGAAKSADEVDNIYGILKKREEDLLMSLNCSNISVFRVFGASGCLTPKLEWSALSSFIVAAKRNEKIVVNAVGRVERSYVSFDTLSELILSMILSSAKSRAIIDACSIQTDIYSLAKEVAFIFNVEFESKVNYNSLIVQHQYIGDSEKFIALCKEHCVDLPSLKEQISITSNSPLLNV